MLPNRPEITSLDFFTMSYHLAWVESDGGAVTKLSSCCTNTGTYGNATSKLIHDADSPNIWSQVDKMGKVFYSAILTDLGQNSSSTSGTDNIFTSPSLLSDFSKPIPTWLGPREAIRGAIETYWLSGGPARGTYDNLRSVTGPLNITPSAIYTQYFCQVPQVKSTGSLIVAILLANLVFLSALWKIFNWLVLHSLQRQDPTTMYCAGCMLQHRQQQLDQQQQHGYDQFDPPPPKPRSLFTRARNTIARSPYTLNPSTPSSPPTSTIGIDIGSFGNHLGPAAAAAASKATTTSLVSSVELTNRRPAPAAPRTRASLTRTTSTSYPDPFEDTNALDLGSTPAWAATPAPRPAQLVPPAELLNRRPVPATQRTSLPRSTSSSYPDPFEDANALDMRTIPAWAATPAPQPARPSPPMAAVAVTASQSGAANSPLHWDGTGWARPQPGSQSRPVSDVSTLSTLAAARSLGRRPQGADAGAGSGTGAGGDVGAGGAEDSVSMYSEASLPLLPR